MRQVILWCALAGAAVSCWLVVANLRAADPPEPYDSLAAGRDAYYYHEAQRRQAIADQIGTIDRIKWFAGFPDAGGFDPAPTYGHTIYYRDPPSLDYVYATGRSSVYSRYPYRAWPGLPDVFEPWPLVPGDVWGYPYYKTVPQPIGQRQIQTGPRRWESHPVYAVPPDVRGAELGAVDSAPVDSPSVDATPRVERPTLRRRSSSGPREF
jgi:hypothetical protein